MNKMKIIRKYENHMNNMKIIITYAKHMNRNENHKIQSYEQIENHNKV